MEGWQSKRMYQSLIGNVQRPNTPKNVLVELAYQFLIGNVQHLKKFQSFISVRGFNPL